jgi:hypothetical protein
MLARTPIVSQAAWRELSPGNHHFLKAGNTLGLVCKVGNSFYAEADRAIVLGRRHGRPLDLGRFDSMMAAKVRVEDALTAPCGDPASDAAALGREARAADGGEHEWANRPDALTTYDVLAGRWIA